MLLNYFHHPAGYQSPYIIKQGRNVNPGHEKTSEKCAFLKRMCNCTIDNTRFNSMIHISLLIKDEIDVLDINMRRVRIFRDIAANLFPTIFSCTFWQNFILDTSTARAVAKNIKYTDR